MKPAVSHAAGGFEVLTFDCYGTLIDWYAGVRQAARDTRALAGIDLEQFVRDRDAVDRELIEGSYAPYARIVALSARRAAGLQGRGLSEKEASDFAASMVRWPPFPESHACLMRMAARYRLGILSNVETRVLESSVALLDAPFEFLITAEQVRSYKPRPAHWEAARKHLGQARVLHVGCSLFHDIRPAHALGFATAFVDREGEGLGAGDAPTFHVRDLTELCALLV